MKSKRLFRLGKIKKKYFILKVVINIISVSFWKVLKITSPNN